MKMYHANVGSGMGISYRTSNQATQLEQILVPINDDEWRQLHGLILDADDGLQHERKRKYILQDFSDIIRQITNNFTASIWSTIKACPLLTIQEVLWLKVDDIDSRVDHIEKNQIQLTQMMGYNHLQRKLDILEKSQANQNIEYSKLIEENKLLQRKIDELEKSNSNNNLENKLLQCKFDELEKLVVKKNTCKELLYELD